MLDHIAPEADVIVGLGNGEPAPVVDAIEQGASGLHDVRLHQMLPLRDSRYIDGDGPGLRHVSWFLSPHDRDGLSPWRVRPRAQQLQRGPEPAARISTATAEVSTARWSTSCSLGPPGYRSWGDWSFARALRSQAQAT
jgi:hypothetical protein